MNKRNKVIALLLIYITIIYKHLNKESNDTIYYYNNEINNPYARYLDTDIYIINNENITMNYENNIVVIDKRDTIDPDMKIIDSYKINDLKTMKKILLILKNYEKEYPSKWNRTILSMQYEWLLHNIAYYLDIDTIRTKDVNLNNNDEFKLLPGK